MIGRLLQKLKMVPFQGRTDLFFCFFGGRGASIGNNQEKTNQSLYQHCKSETTSELIGATFCFIAFGDGNHSPWVKIHPASYCEVWCISLRHTHFKRLLHVHVIRDSNPSPPGWQAWGSQTKPPRCHEPAWGKSHLQIYHSWWLLELRN